MAQWIKLWLHRLLGRRQYLSLVSRLFFWAYRSGLLRRDPDYACHYYVRRFIEPGDYVLDIGANLGYYTVLFAEWTGTKGRVYSVEPVPLYRTVLSQNAEPYPQVEVLPYALGAESATVQLGIPGTAAPYRHGLTQILSEGATDDAQETFTAEVRPPNALFQDLPRLDYVKCDIEGHEGTVLPAMEDLLRAHRPIVQVEVAPDNRRPLYRMMDDLGYRAVYVRGEERVEIESPNDRTRGDWIFLPTS